ncbi:uncharacterized protein YidB (DUF937 family) [Streptomyces griseochromogenes]|nr:uncharacterized protein YidB (DUF937 family) [Streptomyces griseochromogenes]
MSSEPRGGAPDVLQPDEIRSAASPLSEAGLRDEVASRIATSPSQPVTAQQITAVAG